jgi:hypothetical protein
MAKMETIHVDVKPHIAAVARPGDTVLIGFNRALSDNELDQLREDFEGFSETTGVHIVFVEQVSSMVVAKGPERDVNGASL